MPTRRWRAWPIELAGALQADSLADVVIDLAVSVAVGHVAADDSPTRPFKAMWSITFRAKYSIEPTTGAMSGFGVPWSAFISWVGVKRHPWRSTQSRISRRILSCSRSSSANSRSSGLMPPVHALRDATALPSALRGPVLRSQGRHCRISSACRARRSGVQPFAMLDLQ